LKRGGEGTSAARRQLARKTRPAITSLLEIDKLLERGLGAAVPAEGGECDACIDAEFDFTHGHYFGRTVPAVQAAHRTP
jgi:hypothetical protein